MAEQDSLSEDTLEQTASSSESPDNQSENAVTITSVDSTADSPSIEIIVESDKAGDTPEASSAPVIDESDKSSDSSTSPDSTDKDKKPEKKDASSDDEEDRPFDPAVDMPAYRAGMNWFVLRVASNKENYVRETLLKKVQIEGLEILVGRIMVPTEKTKTLKSGKARITETKLYPGYVFVEMKLEDDGRIPQDVFFLIKETTGVGDFVGTAGHPTPMAPHEVEKMLFDSRKPEETPIVKMEFSKGDAVTIQEGPFENYEGTVDEVMPDKGKVRVLVTIFGRQAPVELEYWQIAKADES